MEQYIMALDQGTTSSRAIIFDKAGRVVSIAQKEFKQYFPQAGRVEHDPLEIWSSQASVATEAIIRAGIHASQVAGIGITNQRETTIVWDRRTGEPVYNAIVWQDRRTAPACAELKKQGLEKFIREKTGLVVDAYFSATKVQWILNNVEGAAAKAQNGELAFGTVDSWLLWKLTDGKVHATDVTNASRTMLFNIHTLGWDKELLALFDIPESMLPQVRTSSEIYGHTTGKVLSAQIPICGIAGDQHAALFGQLCLQKGMVKNTYGTGCFMLMNIGSKPVLSQNQLLTTVAWQIGEEVTYALEGSIFMGGAVVQWLRDGLKILRSSDEVEALASEVENSNGVTLVPAFAGLGAPHWSQEARGTILGMTRGTTSAHIARAALESIAFQTRDVLKAMEADSGTTIRELRVDGGACVNSLLMQIQSDVLQTKVVRPVLTETTAMGAAYLAGLAVQFWKDTQEIENQWQIDRTFSPRKSADYQEKIDQWQKAVRTCIAHAQ